MIQTSRSHQIKSKSKYFKAKQLQPIIENRNGEINTKISTKLTSLKLSPKKSTN